MARTLFYFLSADAPEGIVPAQWQSIAALRDFYNHEFFLGRSRIQLDPLEYQPRWPEIYPDSLLGTNDTELGWRLVQNALRQGMNIDELVRQKLVVIKRNPAHHYLGMTHTRDSHWEAFLACEFLLKASLISPALKIEVFDDSDFIPCGHIIIRRGGVEAQLSSSYHYWVKYEKVECREQYVVKNRESWDRHQVFLPLERRVLEKDLEQSPEAKLPIQWKKLFTAQAESGILDLNVKCQEVGYAEALRELMEETGREEELRSGEV
jgi:hypothetical protein